MCDHDSNSTSLPRCLKSMCRGGASLAMRRQRPTSCCAHTTTFSIAVSIRCLACFSLFSFFALLQRLVPHLSVLKPVHVDRCQPCQADDAPADALRRVCSIRAALRRARGRCVDCRAVLIPISLPHLRRRRHRFECGRGERVYARRFYRHCAQICQTSASTSCFCCYFSGLEFVSNSICVCSLMRW